jgi:hypothetical protein
MVLWSVCARIQSITACTGTGKSSSAAQADTRAAYVMALARYHRIVTESKNVRRRFPQRKTACVSAIRQKTINAYAAEAFCEVLLRWRLARIDLHESSMCFLTKLFHSHRLFPREEFQIGDF